MPKRTLDDAMRDIKFLARPDGDFINRPQVKYGWDLREAVDHLSIYDFLDDPGNCSPEDKLEFDKTVLQVGLWCEMDREKLISALISQRGELQYLWRKLNEPEIQSFVDGVRLEAAHQRERWGTDEDDGKAPTDWLFLIGYLAGKVVTSALAGNHKKALHHTISAAAVLANWHANITGTNRRMQPGHHDSRNLANEP
jgi:hypothetical protein